MKKILSFLLGSLIACSASSTPVNKFVSSPVGELLAGTSVNNPFLFSPSDLAGLVAWYQLGTGITNTGAGVSKWADQSGNGRDLLQATDANRPLPGTQGADIVTNGAFTTDVSWTKGTGWDINSTTATKAHHATGTASLLSQASATTLLSQYYLTVYTVSGYVAGTVSVSIAGVTGTARSADGTYTEIITSLAADQVIALSANSTFVGDVDTFSVYPLTTADGILFDGVDNFLKATAFTLNQPTTIYFLGKQITWTSSDKLIDGDSYQVAAINQTGSSPGLRIIAGLEAAANDNLALDTYGVISAVFDGASSLLQIDNTTPTTGNAGTSNAGGITLSAAGNNLQFAHTQIKEVVIYSVAHDASTRRQVIDYLRNVGGL